MTMMWLLQRKRQKKYSSSLYYTEMKVELEKLSLEKKNPSARI